MEERPINAKKYTIDDIIDIIEKEHPEKMMGLTRKEYRNLISYTWRGISYFMSQPDLPVILIPKLGMFRPKPRMKARKQEIILEKPDKLSNLELTQKAKYEAYLEKNPLYKRNDTRDRITKYDDNGKIKPKPEPEPDNAE